MQICDYEEGKKKIPDPNLDTACPAGIPCKYIIAPVQPLFFVINLLGIGGGGGGGGGGGRGG